MKSFPVKAALFCSIVLARCSSSAEPVLPAPAGSASTNGIGPKIQFASTVYDFGRAIVGEQVRHDFTFTNTGDAMLEISGVYPSCGCTTVGTWSRQVEPGKTGTIPLQFNSSRFGAQTVTKTTTVTSNDKGQPTVILQIKGTIWKPIDVNPQMAVLNLMADSTSNAPVTVSIVSGLEEPITLSDPVSNNRAFAAELKTLRPGKEFQLIVSMVPPLRQGNVQGTITLKTSATNVPSIEVTVLGNVQPAIAIMPPQIMLPPGPLNSAFNCAVTIRNNSVTPLTLSEPAVNATGVDANIKEIQPGKQFSVVMTFPAGFQLVPNEEVNLSVKSSNPQFPVVKVPVRQAVRPPPAQPPALLRGPIPPAPAPPAGNPP